MNYQHHYDLLMEKAKFRSLDKKSFDYYTEKHHILPKCMGGSNNKENFVLLTAREHFVAHILLWKSNKNNRSLAYAAHRMLHSKASTSLNQEDRNYKVNSWKYKELREEFAKFIREHTKARTPWNKGLTKNTSIGMLKISENQSGRKVSEESKNKMSKTKKGKPAWNKGQRGMISDETRKKLSESHKGKIGHSKGTPRNLSDETRKKLSNLRKGKTPANAKPVLCLDTGEIFKHSQEAKDKMKLSKACNINGACNGIILTAGGYSWAWA